MSLRKALLFHNPKAGPTPLSQKKIDTAVQKLRKMGYETSVKIADGKGKIPDSSILSDCNLLIVSGGDGTLHGLLPVVVETELPLAILPTGTANVIARELGVPRRIKDALEVIQSGQRKRLRLGCADGQLFHLMAGIGVDGHIIKKVNPASKRSLGVIAFWMAGLVRFWSYPLQKFGIQIGDEVFEATFAVISNSRLYGGCLKITPEASLFNDSLHVCLFTSRSHITYIRYLWGVLTGRHIRYPDVLYREVKRVKLIPYKGLSCQLDGEPLSRTPINFEVAAQSIEVIVPGKDSTPSV